MDNEEPFLLAIADNASDDTARLVYADWLGERGDPRAAFLRIQHAFNHQTPDSPSCRDLCEQEQELAPQLAPTWVQPITGIRQPPHPVGIWRFLFPELRNFARTTTRLHPHRAAGPLPGWASKIGGRFLWPQSEPWPSCVGVPIVGLTPVLQLRRRDVPDVAFPAGTDLLQLFWCPDEAAHGYQHCTAYWWRAAAAVASPRADDPELSGFPRTSDWEGYVPFECSIYPERVIEYPIGDDLDYVAGEERAALIGRLVENMDIGPAGDLAERFTGEHGLSSVQNLAFYELGQCPDSKVEGSRARAEGPAVRPLGYTVHLGVRLR